MGESPSVDVHQHLVPPSFVAALRNRTTPPRLAGHTLELVEGSFRFDEAENDPEHRVALLDRLGIDVAVVSLQPTYGLEDLPEDERGELVAVWEEGIAEVVSGSEGRFVALASSTQRPGFAGVCVGARALAELDTLEPVMASLDAGGGFLFVHPSGGRAPGGPAGWWPAVTLYTAQMQEAYLHWLFDGRRRWPEARVVFAILAGGAPFQLERLASRGVDVRSVLDRNLFFDTASYGRRALELCIETFGVSQLVHGSDLPVVDPEPTLRAMRGFGESVEQLLRGDNARALLT